MYSLTWECNNVLCTRRGGGGGGQEKLYGPHRPILYSLKRGVRICFQNKNRTSKKKDITVFKKGRRGWYPLLKLHFKKNSRVF